MTSSTTNPTAIKGLELVLAGGIRTVRKLGDERESTVVLIRGAAGAGKTIFASHLAVSEAAARRGDVLYCCIELLPTELAAQLSGLTFGAGELAVDVVQTGTVAGDRQAPRVLASIIDIPPEGAPDFGGELRAAMTIARETGFDPKVLVIDSLSEGYRLGRSVARPLADALSKFAAEHGLILVLVEEVSDDEDSLWTFIADVVLDLSHRGADGTAAAERRSLVVRKSRFGPSHVGPHSFTIRRNGGVEVYPRLSSYLTYWAAEFLPRDVGGGFPKWNELPQEYSDPQEVVLVTGNDAAAVAMTATHLGKHVEVLHVDFNRVDFTGGEQTLSCGNPLESSEFLVSKFCQHLELLRRRISAVTIGDLDSIRGNIDPAGLRRALPTLVWLAHVARLPVLLFETAVDGPPTAIHLADVVIEAVAQAGSVSHLLSRPKRNQLRTPITLRLERR